jgi:hypothetical protein
MMSFSDILRGGGLIAKTLDIRRLCNKMLQWYSYLVWMPSSQEIPGLIRLLSSLCPNYWLLFALTVIKPVAIGSYSYRTSFNSLLFSLWALRKYCYVKMSSSTFSCTVFLCNVFGLIVAGAAAVSWGQEEWCAASHLLQDVIPVVEEIIQKHNSSLKRLQLGTFAGARPTGRSCCSLHTK